MDKLKPEQYARLQELYKATENALSDVESAIQDFNREMQIKYDEEVVTAANDFNAAREKLQAFIDELKQEATEHFDDQHEDWQQSDEGNDYSNWIDKFEAAYNDLDDNFEPDEFSELSEPEFDFSSVENIEESP